MLNTKKGLLILTFFLLIGTVTALEVKKTEFVIATEPYQNISVDVFNADEKDKGEALEVFTGRARKFGEYRFTYYGTVLSVNLKVLIINNETGKSIKEETFGPFTLGTPTVNLNFSLGQADEVIEETSLPEKSAVTETPAVEKSPILGFVIGEDGQFRKIYYYVSAGILGLIILVVVLRKHLSMVKSGPVEPHPAKVIKKTKPAKVEIPVQVVEKSNEESINNTEKRIADLQKQLEQIRNEERLVKLQKQLVKEQQELKKLQSEDENVQQQTPQTQDNNQNKF